MARLNTKGATPRKGVGAVKTVNVTAVTHEGGAGFKRDAKSELFLAAVSSFNEDLFYEQADKRQARIATLVAEVASDHEWIEGFVSWLRNEAGLRAIPVIVAAEAVNARLALGLAGNNREIVRASIARLDESAEFLAFWMSRFGRRVPSAVKRGLSDALNDKLNENSFLKWRGRASKGNVSLRDALNIVRAKPKDEHQSALYGAVIAHAYGREVDVSNLPIVKARADFLALSDEAKVAALTGPDAEDTIRSARLTHEVIAGAIGKIPADVWEALIPQMGYTALRMNLRRISEAGVSDDTVNKINKTLADPENVASSKTMPIQFLAAYRNAPLDFAGALQKGANGALDNVPVLSGRTLILVDHSGSMGAKLSERSSLTYSDAANVFAAALALKAENADVVAFNHDSRKVSIVGNDLLRVAESLPSPSGSTQTARAVAKWYDNHDRVIVLTDEQFWSWGNVGGDVFLTDEQFWSWGNVGGDVFTAVPKNVPAFTWNLAGYEAAHAASGPARFTFGGLTDKGFEMIPLIEKGLDQGFPWEN